MANLKTKYLGLELKNPIMMGASNLVTNLDNVKKAEESGAAAIVFKSLFEEQIQLENAQMDSQLEEYAERNAEMVNLFPNLEHAGPEEHLFNVARVKQAVSIPVIASLNAVISESWVSYAKQLEETGIDALELNFYYVPRDTNAEGSELLKQQVETLKKVKAAVKIPVSVKLSPFYANPLNLISKLDAAGADGFVLFNRMFQPEIDVETETHVNSFSLSSNEENRLPLRFSGLLHGKVNGSICSSTGIYNGLDVAKMILAGADCVQVVSSIYKNGISHFETLLKELEEWMNKKGYNTLDDFRGKLSEKNLNDIFVYKRAQYIDLLLKSEEIFNKYPLR